jgi:hypothetical protein
VVEAGTRKDVAGEGKCPRRKRNPTAWRRTKTLECPGSYRDLALGPRRVCFLRPAAPGSDVVRLRGVPVGGATGVQDQSLRSMGMAISY